MIQPKDQRITKMLDLLEQFQLFSADEMTLLEEYLSGSVKEEEIEKLPFRDLSGVPDDLTAKTRELLLEYMDRGRSQEADRLSRILFAAGQSTSSGLFPVQNYFSFDKSAIFASEPAKKLAIYAVGVGMNEYQINRYAIQNMLKIADNKPEIVKQAIEYQKNSLENGKVMLITAYFLLKYPKAEPEEGAGCQGGLLAGVGRLFGQNENTENHVRLDEDDAELMKYLEDTLVNSLPNLYSNQMPLLEMREITGAVNNDKIDARIMKLAGRGLPVKRFMLSITGGPAFVNYALSKRLKNVLTICLAANTDFMLSIMSNIDLRDEFRRRGGNFASLFGIDPGKYIAWAGSKKEKAVLPALLSSHRDAYLAYMQKADFDTFNLMNAVIREKDPKLYQERRSQDHSKQESLVIEAFVQLADAQCGNTVRSYLKGETGIDALYALGDKLTLTGSRWGGKHWNILKSYQEGCGQDALGSRCEAFLMAGRGFNYYGNFVEGRQFKGGRVKQLFEAVDAEGLNLKCQLNGYADLYDSLYTDRWKEQLCNSVRDTFLKYLKDRREETVEAFQEAGSTGRCFGLQILSEDPEANKDVILSFSQDSSKAVREELLSILYKKEAWAEDVEKLLSSKKAADRELAIRVLTRWDAEKYTPVLTQALEKEKNAKVRSLLETALHVSGGGNEGAKEITREDLVKELHKGGKKRSLAWAYETPFSTVHKKDGEEAGEEYLQAIFLSYASMSPCGVSPTAATLADALDEKEFALYVNELFDKWMEAGAESKKRWVLYAAAIHGGGEIVRKLQHQIQEWPLAARGAIASEAVQALALSPQPQALLIVDGISRKFKFKQVKAAAGKALEFAASQLGITTEELADRIVPDLGFDENMERCFDYGERKFTVTITTALEIEVFDESGKKLKNLPAPGKRDDEAKAAAAYEEFKQMKKQMKTTVSSQKMRLEMALSTGRQWGISAWKDLFVKNPVMHQFATGLIWGVFEEKKLTASFRYMEDGSFNTEEEDEFELPEESSDVRIGIVHPIELTADSLKAWKEQLEDYEIIQPIEQLERQVYYRTKEEEGSKSLERFGGCIVNDLSLGGKLQGMGWYRGSVQDAGGFYSYYREDKELALGVELHFSGSYVGGQNEDVTVYEARFYPTEGTVTEKDGSTAAAGIRRGSYVYDEANDSNSCFLKEIPERYFSEIVLQLSKATASSKEKNENWKTTR